MKPDLLRIILVKDAVIASRWYSGEELQPAWANQYARLIVMTRAELPLPRVLETFAHEATHCLLHYAGRRDRWLIEGLAVWASEADATQLHRNAWVALHVRPDCAASLPLEVSELDADLYAIAGSLVGFLVDRHGWANLDSFLRPWSSFKRILERASSSDFPSIERLWRDHLSSQFDTDARAHAELEVRVALAAESDAAREAAYQRALGHVPSHPWALAALADIRYDAEMFDEARRLAESALSACSEDAVAAIEAHDVLGKLADREGCSEDALSHFRSARDVAMRVGVGPRSVAIWHVVYASEILETDASSALDSCREALELDSEYPRALRLAAESADSLNRFDEARRYAKSLFACRAAETWERWWALFELASIARKEEKWDLAITFYEKALALEEAPDEDYSHSGAREWIGECLTQKAWALHDTDPNTAERWLHQALDLLPGAPLTLYALARIAGCREDYSRARDFATKILALREEDTNDWWRYHAQWICLFAAEFDDDLAEAIARCSAILMIDQPENPEDGLTHEEASLRLLRHRFTISFRAGNLAEAKQLGAEVLTHPWAQERSLYYAHATLGIVAEMEGRLSDAGEHCRKALLLPEMDDVDPDKTRAKVRERLERCERQEGRAES